LFIFAIGVVAITVFGGVLARLVVGPLADWVANAIDAPTRHFSERHAHISLLEAADQISVLGSFAMTAAVVLFVSGFCWLRRRDPRPAIVLVATFVGAAFVTLAVKYGVHRSPASGPTGRFSAGTFPSGHGLLATAVYGTLAVLLVQATGRGRPLRIVVAVLLVLITCAIGASRIYNLDHYASDVLGSFLLGIALVIDATVLARGLAGTPRPDTPPA
jgi:undecaprenyl-diphosphatase